MTSDPDDTLVIGYDDYVESLEDPRVRVFLDDAEQFVHQLELQGRNLV
jgi:hypothetical protein